MTDHHDHAHISVSIERPDGVTEILPNAMRVGTVETGMRRFVLDRVEDVSGTSGTGFVAEGIEFSDGTAVLRWTVELQSTAVYASMADLEAIHGHGGSTAIRWLDE